MTTPVVIAAGLPALGTMLFIAGVALVLGLVALWLSRRHTDREAARLARSRAEREQRRQNPDLPGGDGSPVDGR
jgi:hypothetical protein